MENIFNSVKYLTIKNDDVDERLDVVTSIDEINGRSAMMNKKLNSRVTLIWEDEKNKDELERDDFYGAIGEIQSSCGFFKHCTIDEKTKQSKYCGRCDTYHYKLLKSRIKNEKCEEERPDFFYEDYIEPELKIDPTTEVNYLEYHCPILGYNEMIFPVIVDDVFLGAVFIGQLLKNDEKAQSIFDEFIRKHSGEINKNEGMLPFNKKFPRTHTEFLSVLRTHELEKPIKISGIMNDLIIYLKKDVTLYNDLSYVEFQNKCFKIVKDLNKFFQLTIDKKREKVLINTLEKVLNIAIDKISRIEPKKKEESKSETTKKTVGYNELKRKFEFVLRAIYMPTLKELGTKSIRIYGLGKKPIPSIRKNSMELVLSTKREEKNIFIDIVNLPKDIFPKHPWEPHCVIADCGIANTAGSSTDLAKGFCMLLLYKEWLVEIEVQEEESRKKIYKVLLRVLEKHITRLLTIYEVDLLEFMSTKHYLTLLLYRHECAKIASAINSKNKLEYGKLIKSLKKIKGIIKYNDYDYSYQMRDPFCRRICKLINELNIDNLSSVCDDITANVQLIVYMADTIGIITGRLNKETIKFDEAHRMIQFNFVKDILFKCIKTEELDAALRQNHNEYHVIGTVDGNIHQRKRLIDIVFYNLIDNARKYSYWGTKIYINLWDAVEGEEIWDTEKSSVINVIIENYGVKIEEYPKAFELYNRGSIVTTHIEGDGLGLFVVKTISDILELNIRYKSEYISEFNVGLIDKYIHQGSNPELILKLDAERKRLIRRKIFDEVVNSLPSKPISNIDVSNEKLEKYITEPTHRVIFEFEIPKKSCV
jgi:signal transduction histidine kinase